MANAVVVLENVSLRYGSRPVVERLSLDVHEGEIVGLLGPNGSGKSSTLAAIAGLLDPATGSIRIKGTTRRERPLDYARHIGLVPQEPALYEELTAFDNLDFFASLYDVPSRQRKVRIAAILERVGLTARAGDRVGTYSGGMQRRLNLAAALIHNPPVLLLDESSAALDAASRDMLFELLDELRGEGKAILFATHHLDEAERWCDRVAILRQGQCVALGRPGDLFRRPYGVSELTGVLHDELAESVEESIRQQLDLDTNLEIIGRRIRIVAADAEQLGLALAVLGSEGAQFDSFGTPSLRLDRIGEQVNDRLLSGDRVCSGN